MSDRPAPTEEIRRKRRQRVARLGYDYSKQPVERIERCNLCDDCRFVVIADRDRYGYPAHTTACLRCGLVFLNPRMTAAAYARFYDGIYRSLVSAYHDRLIDARTVREDQRGYADERVSFLAGRLDLPTNRQPRLLDVGGSTGVVAARLGHEFGLRATVLDPAPAELDIAETLGLETVSGSIEEYDPGGRTFDLITVCQAIDHFLDVRTALHRLRDMLAEGGRLFVDIVDFRAAYLRESSVEEATKIDHPYYLTQQTMEAYLRRVGLRVLAMDHAADSLHVGYLCAACEPEPEGLPDAESTVRAHREMRYVQNGPRP